MLLDFSRFMRFFLKNKFINSYIYFLNFRFFYSNKFIMLTFLSKINRTFNTFNSFSKFTVIW